ncbi:EF-hand calcium-binding domain-containing protein 5-like isoform X2 [Biomphalaria glabrata]|uniref:EF-hand calcium-binding domain-containing protein 5-like isoform X2 n=1 Tax=Biomphalaria glabrata TaxID=6526 RepID=A0A9W2YH73_BIOGL|nr:EF-hand calcium-binding domain-containing protein 5-like isoform X2 [Biomphalaria glabrata]
MEDDFDYNDTATAPTVVNDFLMENLCGRKGQQAGGYSPPAPRSASKRWKNLNEQNMMLMLENKHLIKKKNLQKSKEQAREIIRKIPVEVLAKEWLSKEDATVDMRAYLVDHVLPTLILGVEKLLKVVDEKGLSATNRYEPEFNPINYLAQYLMRNNPRFSNFSEASPYVRGLREVSEEIKQELFTFEDNRLARIKAEARRKRAERERVEQQQQEAKLKRMEQLLQHFQQWSVPVTNNKVELAMVQNALISFCEMAALWPKEMREAAKFGKPLDPTDETGNMLSTEEFAQYLTPFVEELSMDIFEAFMIHMNKCAAIYRAAAEKEVRRNMLTNLFLMCDHGRLGLLDRQRILELFEKFWDTTLQNKEFMGTLRNPRRFPVIEVEEVDDSMFDAWEDEPDGGLTVVEMQIASAEMARVQQEVHRLATIATVQDKSAVEKWKIKQLSEKSEGMRWKLYKYNVTDFLNIFEYNYFDTLEAPKQNLNLQERIESGNMRHHDLHLMTISRTKEERDTVLGRVKVLDSEEVSVTTLDEVARDKHDSDIDNINDNRGGKEIGQSVNNNSNMADETSCGSEQETGDRIAYAKVQNVGDECNTRSVSTQVVYYSNQSCRDVAQRKPMEDIPMVKHKCKMKDTNNNMAKFREGRTTDSSSDTDTTVTELGLYSNSYTNRKDESNEYLESEFLTSDESLTVNDQNASDATYEESDEEVWFEKLSQLRKTLANVLPVQPHTLGPVRMNQQTLRTESRTRQHSTELASMEHSLPPLHKSYNVDRSTSPFQPLPPISTKKHVRFQSVQSTVDKGSQSMDPTNDQLPKTSEMNRFDSFMQSQQEISKTGGSSISSANNVEHNELLRKLSLPVGEFLKILCTENNINYNKQLADININSCNRVRNIIISTNQRSQSQLSAFDENTLNISQFVLLVETLLGHDPSKDIFERIVKHIKDGYSDTEQEKMDRLVKTRKQVISAKRKFMIDNLFEKWDNDGSGYLEMEEIQEVLFKYKDGQELDVIKRAQNALKKKSKFNDQRLSKQEFRELIELLVKEMSGPENFELLVEFLMNSVERSYAERIRGEARKKWLQQIISEGHVSGKLLDPVYKAVFQALYKDAEMHGGEKRISANIAMLEINRVDLSRGPMLLRYAACTPEDCPYMLGKCLFKNMKGVSFQAVETGKPVHVPRVSNHGNIYFWNYNRPQEEKEGSLVVIPLKDKKKRVFGVMGIDTVQDSNKKSIFITHEIQFFQGVAKAFSIAYHTVEMKRKLLRVADSAISWMNRRCPHITEIIIYLVEPNLLPNRDPVLRKMMVAKKGPGVHVTEVVRLERKDNLFRDYLFQCMENSETVCADAYGERHTALPLRDLEGKAIGVVDISIGEMKQLPSHENKEAQRMLRLLQKAVKEIVKESQGEEKKKILDAENDEASRVAIMFDSLMLAELRENVSKLDIMAFAELKSYYQPPKVILEICRAALAIFDIERAGEGQYEDWPIVKNNIHSNLIHQIKTYDPTKASEFAKTEKIARYLRAIPHGEVGRYGSIPAMLLYNWVFCCLSLIEHTVKMREMEAQNESAPPPEIKPSIMT